MDLPGELASAFSPQQPVSLQRPRTWGWGPWLVAGTLTALAGGSGWMAWLAATGRVDGVLGASSAVLGFGYLAVWLLNLARWGLGSFVRPVPARMEVRTGEARGLEMVFLTFDWRGRLRYQQVVWEPWIPELPGEADVLLRRCPGLRPMFLVDVPGRGRLWPSRASNRKPPWRMFVGPALFGEHRLAWLGTLLWTVPAQALLAVKYGLAELAVTLPLQAGILLMLGTALSGAKSAR